MPSQWIIPRMNTAACWCVETIEANSNCQLHAGRTHVPYSTVEFRTFCRLGGSLSSGKSLFSLNRISATWVQSRPKDRNSTVVYKTAWLLTQKLRRSMADPNRTPLEGVVEVDQAEIPFRVGDTYFEPGNAGKILIAAAIEVIDRDTHTAKPRRKGAKYLGTRSGRLRLAVIADNTAASIEAFVRANVKPGTTLISDGHASYPGLSGDYRHDPRRRKDGGAHCSAVESSRLLAAEAMGHGYVSRPTPQAHRHLSR